MTKKNFGMIVLFIFAITISISSLYFSIWIYVNDFGSKIAAHSSSEASIGLSVETSGATCGDDLCNGVETCSICPGDCGTCPSGSSSGSGGGGGGGSGTYTTPKFKISQDNFNIKLTSGESETNEIIIENIGEGQLDIKVSVTGIENIIVLNSNSIYLFKGESAPLRFTINAPEPGVYAGKIILTHQGVSKEVLILLNVVSEGVLFDTIVTVPDLYRVLREGQRLPVLIELIEIGGETGVDVTMNYIIKDFEGNTHYTESETFYVKGAKSYSKRFSTQGIKPGDYVLGVELIYIGGFATSTAHFKISDSIITPQTWVAVGSMIIAIIVALSSIIFFKIRSKKQNAPKLRSTNHK
ncbi:MAG: hypothetical protein AABW89_01160 [Nanoarchaeota archaeon]